MRASSVRIWTRALSGEEQPPTDYTRPSVHLGNLIATRDRLVWIDFEEVCRGPVEWDLALMAMFDAADAVAACDQS